MKKRNPFTFPGEAGHEATVLDVIGRWKPDAIRDSDGTHLSDEIQDLGLDVYSTLCLVRADQDFAWEHPEYHVRKYLMSFPATARKGSCTINPLEGYSRDKYVVDDLYDHHKYWEVIDRSTGEVHSPRLWRYDSGTGLVTIEEAADYHEYTVNFLVRQVWDSVSMYNAIVNGWTGRNTIGVDPYHKVCREHLYSYFSRWLDEHSRTDVVRFTTFAYQFVIDSGENNEDLYRDWLGYGECVSPKALEDFEKEYGYALRPEDFVDQGFYNATTRPPSRRYRDWMEFIHKFVVEFSGTLVKMANQKGKRTGMFQGDHWIGTETFSEGYQEIGLDINIGAVEDGVALRRLSDSPGPQLKEARFYPYFFPDVFREGGDPVGESLSNWIKIRRALLRKPIDRIGYGGRISLAAQFPDFIDHVEQVTEDFRLFIERSEKSASWTYPVRVGILNGWGQWRSWLQNNSIDQKFHVPSRPDVMEFVGTNTLECLAGLPFPVSFINFDDIRDGKTLEGLDVIINSGDAGTSWSGGPEWADPEITAVLRKWVAGGGGFLGIGSPSAYDRGNRFFQLADVLGVDKETGKGLGYVAGKRDLAENHFIDEDLTEGNPDLEVLSSAVFPVSKDLEILQVHGAHVLRSANRFESGRSIYMAGLPYGHSQARMLLRTILWLAGKEESLKTNYSSHMETDCAFYPETGWTAVVNNSGNAVETDLYGPDSSGQPLSLGPYEWKWIKTE